MKNIIVVVIIICVALLVMLPQLHPPEQYVCGRIRIPAAGISAEVMTASHGADCGCCAPLWQGGIASTTADLSSLQVDDTAELLMLDGSRLVLECAEIVPCIHIGNALIGWRGVIKAQGDVLLVCGGRVYRLVRL